MDIECNDKEFDILQKVGSAAQALDLPCYLVGGFVRDKLLGRRTKDADFVCVGDGMLLANKAATLFRPQPTVNHFKNFGTAQFKLHDGFDLEFENAIKAS